MLSLDALQALGPPDRRVLIEEHPEDQWFDRKRGAIDPRKLAETLVAMANAEGGIVVVGVDPRGPAGIASPRRENALRQTAIDFTTPTVPCQVQELLIQGDDGSEERVLVFVVHASDRLHATHKDEVFLRIGDETRKLTFEQRRELEFDKGQSNFELTPARQVDWDDLDQDLLDELAERLGSGDGRRLLQARGLLGRDEALTTGAVLLFARHPEAELPEAHVRVVRYSGDARGAGRRQRVTLDRRIEGPLSQQIERAATLLDEVLPKRRALGESGRFTDVGIVPRDAWLEGIVNAVIHRSYSLIGDHIRVEVFDDRLEISSPGRFPGIIDLDDPSDIHRFARNPRIARVLSDLDYGQELGEGIRRMFEEMRLAGLAEPEYRQSAGGVRLTLLAEPVDRALEDRLSPDARQLVRAIRDAGRLGTGHLADVSGRSRPTVLRDLRQLERAGIVTWVGNSPKDPRAYWQLAD